MSQYQMRISGKIRLSDYSSIHDYMAIVNKNDNLIITMDDNELDNVKIIKSILENDNFVVELTNEYNDGMHCIKASKDK